jgi:hypothetical protein
MINRFDECVKKMMFFHADMIETDIKYLINLGYKHQDLVINHIQGEDYCYAISCNGVTLSFKNIKTKPNMENI